MRLCLGVKVSVDEAGVLHWPVYFLYPEHSESDFIQQFPETDRYLTRRVNDMSLPKFG